MLTTTTRPPLEIKIPPFTLRADVVDAPGLIAEGRRDPFVSVVIPAMNEADNLPVLHEKLAAMMAQLALRRWEMVVVDDGSTDGTLEVLRSLAADDQRVRYVSLSRNFGHQPALRAGMTHSRGDCLVAMDADLQHPPALLAQMLAKWQEGYDVITTLREDVKEAGLFKRATSRSFYRLVNVLGEVRIEPGSADFYLLDRTVVDAIRGLPETEIFFRGMLPWLGFRCHKISYRPGERLHGASKYRIRKMFSLALTGIMATSVQPLRLAVLLSVVVAGLTMLYAAYAASVWLFMDQVVPGWASVIVVVSALGSMQLLVLGIIGEYLGRVLREARRRPSYVVRATNCERDATPSEGKT